MPLAYSTTPRIRNRLNRNHLGILGLRIGLFCALDTKETSKETYKSGTRLLGSKMPVPISRSRTVLYRTMIAEKM
jgi:hypothetical protein